MQGRTKHKTNARKGESEMAETEHGQQQAKAYMQRRTMYILRLEYLVLS